MSDKTNHDSDTESDTGSSSTNTTTATTTTSASSTTNTSSYNSSPPTKSTNSPYRMGPKRHPSGQTRLCSLITIQLLLLYTLGLVNLRLKLDSSDLEKELNRLHVPQDWRDIDVALMRDFTSTDQIERVITVQKQRQVRFPNIDDAKDDTLRILFYHIYLPQEALTEALRIVREQLEQIATHTPTGKQTMVLYNTVGARKALTPPMMHQWCEELHLQCRNLQHFESGAEELTLQMVHQFCHQQPATHRIGYLHNKGSYHPSQLNEQWRRLMTHALVRDNCWPPRGDNDDIQNNTNHNGTSSNSCNVCGLYFTFDRGLYMSGNIWTSTCGYIQQLIEPQYFEANMSAVVTDAWLQSVKTARFGYTQYPQESSFLGLDRYANEWWIGSHPTIEPCDYSRTIDNDANYDRTKQFLQLVQDTPGMTMPDNNWTFAVDQHFPGQPYRLPHQRLYNRQKMSKDPDYWKKEYFLLPGIVHRWIGLYHQLPPASSWVWRHFPQGDRWRRAVEKYGLDVVSRIVEEEGPPVEAS
jgi:hypothetical protein